VIAHFDDIVIKERKRWFIPGFVAVWLALHVDLFNTRLSWLVWYKV
jgi:hypothetical protein